MHYKDGIYWNSNWGKVEINVMSFWDSSSLINNPLMKILTEFVAKFSMIFIIYINRIRFKEFTSNWTTLSISKNK